MKLLAIPCLLLAVVGCSPAPLVEDLDLEEYLVSSGDLPAGLQPAQVRSTIPDFLTGIPLPGYQLYQQFTIGEKSNGGVTVLVFEDQVEAESAYDALTKEVIQGQESWERMENSYSTRKDGDLSGPWDVGLVSVLEYTTFVLTNTFSFEETEAVFLKCNAVVHVKFYNVPSGTLEAMQSYATRLADRLDPLVCQEFSQNN